MNKRCVLLFSGGTDSLCSAAILANQYQEIDLITYYEKATEHSNKPTENVIKLKQKFTNVKFRHLYISVDRLVRNLSYESYIKNLFKYGFYNLSNAGISSLCWHIRTIKYCLDNKISSVYDGMTKELMHLPGHDPEVRSFFSTMYLNFNINFSSPVITWEVPPAQQYVDRLIVDQHGFTKSKELVKESTTGSYLHKIGLLPHANVKGSLFDQKMQHDCYPFVIYNIFVFWWAYPVYGENKHKIILHKFMRNKIEKALLFFKSNNLNLFEKEIELF